MFGESKDDNLKSTKKHYFYRVEYIKLAAEYQPLNLGQGFPDFAPLEYITETLKEVAKSNPMLHQYTRGFVKCLYSC